MESISLQQLRIVEDQLHQIQEAIQNLELWLPLRSEIPWKAVKGMRDHIAHGYFDINTEFIWDVIKNDLPQLREAINYLTDNLFNIIPFEE